MLRGFLTLLCAVAALVNTTAAAPVFHVEALGLPAGASSATGRDVNEQGQVLVQAASGAFVWEDGAYTQLPSSNLAMNFKGQRVAGAAFGSGAALWVDKVLTPLASGSGGLAWDVNASGDAAGFIAGTSSNGFRDTPVVWQQGVRIDIGGGSRAGRARGISDDGVVAGSFDDSGRGFIWRNGQITEFSLFALAMNNLHQVVGLGGMWDNGTITNTGMTGRDINDLTQISGDGKFWDSGTLYDLNAQLDDSSGGWLITGSSGLNNQGQIAATGTYGGGPSTPLLLTPVPEPAGVLLLGSAWGFTQFRPRSRDSWSAPSRNGAKRRKGVSLPSPTAPA